MCRKCSTLRTHARWLAEEIETLDGQLTAKRADLGTLRAEIADHAALHPYRYED